jgi:hypothetical protein
MFGFTLPWSAPQGGDASAPEASEVNRKDISVRVNAEDDDPGGDEDGNGTDDGVEIDDQEGLSVDSVPNEAEQNEDGELRKQPQGSSQPEAFGTDPPPQAKEATEDNKKPIKLYKSPRLKGYITIVLASGIHFNSVQRSGYISSQSARVVPSSPGQRQYGLAVCTVNMVLCIPVVICHLDRITSLEKVWTAAFRPKSSIELLLAAFLSIWNVIAVGVETSVNGIAGSGKAQFNIYFSVWILCLTSLWILERWWIDYGWSSFRSFVTSWPYRAPAWICIIILSVLDMIWTVDLWRNYNTALQTSVSNSTDVTVGKFEPFLCCNMRYSANWFVASPFFLPTVAVYQSVPQSQWQWFVILLVFTLIPAVAFVAIELFRDTNADGSTQEKTKVENVVEGVIFLLLVLAWIPTVGTVTTPNGAASMVGNAYFFSTLDDQCLVDCTCKETLTPFPSA